jgi:hypothetical protein
MATGPRIERANCCGAFHSVDLVTRPWSSCPRLVHIAPVGGRHSLARVEIRGADGIPAWSANCCGGMVSFP